MTNRAIAAGAPVTAWLAEWENGNESAGRRAIDAVYDELRRVARRYAAREAADAQATAIVHEACLRLLTEQRPALRNRGHLVAIVARLMRQVLVNDAKRRRAIKRGGGAMARPLNDAVARVDARSIDLIALDHALDRLAEAHPRRAAIVELRFFGGLTAPETAAALETSLRTVEREWTVARADLRREIDP